MKQTVVQTIEQDGHVFGQVSSPDDLKNAQIFAHDHIAGVTHDFINNANQAEVVGFDYELGGGNAFNMTLSRPGRIYTKDGTAYDLLQNPDDDEWTLTFDAADVSYPRLDLIVGVLEDAVPVTSIIPYVRLRTTEELEDNANPYAPTNLSQPTEKHWRVVPQIKKGSPSANPVIPTFDTNEIPLYIVSIAPGVTHLDTGDVNDVRNQPWTLRDLNNDARAKTTQIDALATRVGNLEDLAGQTIDIDGVRTTLRDYLLGLFNQIAGSNDMPDVRFTRPKYDLTDDRTSQIVASGGVNTVPTVDVEIGGKVNFGISEVAVLPQKFADQSLNPRYEQISGGAAHVQRDVDLTLDDVTQITSDGFTDFSLRSSVFDASRAKPAAAARDSQFIEVFGGLASDNNSGLSDWFTYDVINDTLTPKTITGATLPACTQPVMFSCGDGTNVLLIASGGGLDPTPKCFRINAVDGIATEITTTKPTGYEFFGGLITAGKVFIVAVQNTSGYGDLTPTFWEYDTAAHTFALLGTSGSLPGIVINKASGCIISDGKFLLLTYNYTSNVGRPPEVGYTYVFNYNSLSWTWYQGITAPQHGTSYASWTGLSSFRMANVNGRPLLVGDNEPTPKVWEFKPATLQWVSSNATFPATTGPGFCSTLAGNSLPMGKAMLFGGWSSEAPVWYNNGIRQNTFVGPARISSSAIYSSIQSGLIAVTYGGVQGISIATGSSFVQFEVDAYTAAWAIAAYRASFAGSYSKASLKIEASFDDGDNWHEIAADATYEPTDSDTPGVRRLRVTMYQNPTNPPILTKLSEALDQDGGDIEDRQVVRFDAPDTEMALYIDSLGNVTLSEDIEPSTATKAILFKITPNGSSSPTIKNYINRRRPHVRKSVTRTNPLGDSIKFDNNLAVPVRFANAYVKTVSTGVMYKIAEPTVDFDADGITLTGVATTGDVGYIELEG